MTWTKTAFRAVLKAKIAKIDLQRSADGARDPNISVTYHEEKESRDALLWLAGKPCDRDFKIESRQSVDGQWRHTLMCGAMGYSASNPLVTIVSR